MLAGPCAISGTCRRAPEGRSPQLGVAALKSQGLDLHIMRGLCSVVGIHSAHGLVQASGKADSTGCLYDTQSCRRDFLFQKKESTLSPVLTYQPSGTGGPKAPKITAESVPLSDLSSPTPGDL